MAIERINSMGTMNISPSPKPRPVESAAVTANIPTDVRPEQVVMPTSSQSSDSYSQDRNQDKSEVMKGKEVTPGKVKSAVDDLNAQLKSTRCSFKYHEETNRISITVIDKETDEVIKEIPPEKTLDMIAKAWELAGLMVDERR